MNTKRIGWGIVAWFLGITVPVMHHVLLHWPVAGASSTNVVTRSRALWESLPWIEWAYLAAMAVVGLVLIVSGVKSRNLGE